MGTRGYVVIKVGGRYYAFYNHWDSYPTGLGRDVMALLVRLIRRFGGDIQGLCEFIRTQLSIMTIQCDDHGYWLERETIHSILKAKPGDLLEVEMITLPEHNTHIEYIWTLDFDSAEFIMTAKGRCRMLSQLLAGGRLDASAFAAMDAATRNYRRMAWPMKHLHRHPDGTAWAEAADEFLDTYYAEHNEDDAGRDLARQKYCRNLFAAIIQTWWRRLRAYRQALEPDTGLLFQLAKRRFEAARDTA